MEREWENEEEMERKWRKIHSLHFLIFSFFPPALSVSYLSKIVSSCRKMLNTALLARMSQKINMSYEKIILDRICCEKALEVVTAWCKLCKICKMCRKKSFFLSINIFLLFLLCSSSHKSKCYEVQSLWSPFNLADLFSPRIWSRFWNPPTLSCLCLSLQS